MVLGRKVYTLGQSIRRYAGYLDIAAEREPAYAVFGIPPSGTVGVVGLSFLGLVFKQGEPRPGLSLADYSRLEFFEPDVEKFPMINLSYHALSMVILAPISQFGCDRASFTVTVLSSSMPFVRNGPPDAVIISRLTDCGCSPTRHWYMAECSESTGTIRDCDCASLC